MGKVAAVLVSALLMAVASQAAGYYSPPSPGTSELKVGHYHDKCPYAEDIVKGVVGAAVHQNPGIGAGLIRMLFHDCFVEGCDASVLLDPTPANLQPEKLFGDERPELVDETTDRDHGGGAAHDHLDRNGQK